MSKFFKYKLGEVLAFAQVSGESMEQGRKAYEQALSPELASKATITNNEHMDRIREYVQEKGWLVEVEEAGHKTAVKLRSMRDTYLNHPNMWNDSAEISEWAGFFEGAATAHWAIIQGIAKQIEDAYLLQFAIEGENFHGDLLSVFIENIHDIAMERIERGD